MLVSEEIFAEIATGIIFVRKSKRRKIWTRVNWLYVSGIFQESFHKRIGNGEGFLSGIRIGALLFCCFLGKCQRLDSKFILLYSVSAISDYVFYNDLDKREAARGAVSWLSCYYSILVLSILEKCVSAHFHYDSLNWFVWFDLVGLSPDFYPIYKYFWF